MNGLFIYIHIPFCVKKCLYCDFLSVPYDNSSAKSYLSALCKELELKKNALVVQSLYIGGGTPSLLTEDCLNQLFKCFRTNFIFSDNIEITFEVNPGTLEKSKIDSLLLLGVNRISIGVQSFNDDELQTLGRVHSAGNAFRSIGLLRESGLNNISLDLMYGIPGQTMETWRKTISNAVALLPRHISSYELTPEEKTPLYSLIESGKIKMPDEELVLEMYYHAIDSLNTSGYEHYEISNFAMPGCKCIHNLNYWNRGDYIGAGAGAHSFINGIRLKNTEDIDTYIKDLYAGTIPETDSLNITQTDSAKEFIFLGLRKIEGIRVAELKMLGLNIADSCMNLIDEGYLEIRDGYLRLKRKGLTVSNMVIVSIFNKSGL